MALIRPRLSDYHNLALTQENADFAIPFLDEDLPLYVDPFLLWKSPSMQDNALHRVIVETFNHLGKLWVDKGDQNAVRTLIECSECAEVGLGNSKSRKGHRISEKTAIEILELYRAIPQIRAKGISHIEEVQLLVAGVSKDRISDISCTLLKSFLIDYTIDQCEKHGIPMTKTRVPLVYDFKNGTFADEEVFLPTSPATNEPILLTPKRWLRYVPWISLDDYYDNHYIKNEADLALLKVQVLGYNRHNYGMVEVYVKTRERQQNDCHNDPLFRPIPVLSAKRKLDSILKLQTGKGDNADRQYEDHVCQLMASLLYPHLDFAKDQSRTDSGVLIRDLVFYNSRSMDFLEDIHRDYGSRQLVMELKNVKAVEREHVNQLNRYLVEQFGKFGIIITRHRLPKAIFRNTIDLWAGQRKCILALDDEDLKLMVSVFESRQRSPIEVIKKKYVEFTRECPS